MPMPIRGESEPMPFRARQRLLPPSLAAFVGLACLAPAHAAPDGAALYTAQCSVCHQADAGGAPGQFPPLKNRVDKIAGSPEGKSYLADLLTHGMSGSIDVGGDSYVGYMPSFAQLPDEQLAAILTYVSSLGDAKPTPGFTADDLKAARAHALTAAAVNKERQALAAKHPLP